MYTNRGCIVTRAGDYSSEHVCVFSEGYYVVRKLLLWGLSSGLISWHLVYSYIFRVLLL